MTYNVQHSIAYAGSALALIFSTNTFGATPPIDPSEFPTTRKAICVLNKKPVTTPQDITACEAFVLAKSKNFSNEEVAAAVDAACLERHKAHHISYYDACRLDLYKNYNVTTAITTPAPAEDESTVVGSCAKGAAVGVVTGTIIHIGAFLLDIGGCMGACSAAAAAWTVPTVTGQIALGCAGGVAAHVIENSTKSPKSKDGAASEERPAIPKPAPRK